MIFLYLFTLILLGIYSYSQIDLNLTLFQNSTFLSFQNTMIQLGYFNRPLSTGIFVVLIFIILYTLYFILSRRFLRGYPLLICGIILIGLVSYPAFSHDIFNYMFDAKILTFYHQNPYFFKALDFPADPWLRFMHWVHRTYPYGPFWLLATAPLSFLGFGKFIPTLLNFKLFFVGVYLLNIKLLQKISPKNYLLFALNPLVIIESVISPHLDSFMTLFLLLAVYFYRDQDKIKSWLCLIISIGTKFITVVLAPLFFLKKFPYLWGEMLLLITTALVVWQRGPYPWYVLPILALGAISGQKFFCFALSAGALLTYVPYLLIGSYPREVLQAQYVLLLTPLIIFGLSQSARIWPRRTVMV